MTLADENRASSKPKTLDALASRSFCRVADARQFDGNAVRLLRDARQNYPAWLDAIAGARKWVHIENYLIQEDEVGEAFAAALSAAARRGVSCRVLYDWLGCSLKASRRFWWTMRDAGVDVRCYNRPHAVNPLLAVSRNHRKVLCVDGEIGFTGGLCIGQSWAGRPERGQAPWRDTAVEIRGPAAAYLSHAFADSWRTAGNDLPAEELRSPDAVASAGPSDLWVVAGVPDSMGLYRLELLVAEIVEHSLWLADAYFVATTSYVRALTSAARAGVDVRLLVPKSGNLPVVRAISRSSYRPLLEAGVRVFEWNGSMMHAKTAVADGAWSRVGSSNSNLASWISNRELDVTIHDRDFARQMEEMYLEDLDNATEVLLKSGRVHPTGNGEGMSGKGLQPGSAGRLLAGAVGVGSAVGASLARHRLLEASESRTIAMGGGLLLALALVAWAAPEWVAYPIGAAALWVGITLLVRARRLRRSSE
jgi:cardiolipin synthase